MPSGFSSFLQSEKNNSENWINKKWRPMMGWVYIITCITDFIIFPVLWNFLQVYTKQSLIIWQPITLQSSGLYHLAMGAVLGITSFGRSKEKIEAMKPSNN